MRWIVEVVAPGPPVAARQLGEEVRDVRGLGVLRPTSALRQEGAELEQVGTVGLQRVARHPPLELEVREEVEHQLLEPRRHSPFRNRHP